jgi:pimeloyl-ACP methyl ester carboxylesterase
VTAHIRTRPALPASSEAPGLASALGPLRKPGKLGGALIAGAGAMAATALAVRHLANKAEGQSPPVGQFVTIDGIRLHYTDHGDGPAVLLIHGNGTLAQDWEVSGLTERLVRQGQRVIAIDRPGYGYSSRPRSRVWTGTAQAELIAHFLRELQVGPAVIVGHSWGTIVALALAVDHPDLVRSLVLLSGYYFPSRRADVWLLSPPALPIIGDVMRYTISPVLARLFLKRLVGKTFAPRPIPRRFRESFPVELALRPSQIRASAADSGLMIPSAARLHSHYGELSMPVTIMAGEGDEIVTTQDQALRLHYEIAHSSLKLFPGVGHMLHYYVQDEIAEQVRGLTRHIASVEEATVPVRETEVLELAS